MLVRLTLVAVSLAAIALSIWGYRSVQNEERAVEIARTPPQERTGAIVEAALREFERARRLNPDTRPMAEQALLLAAEGRIERSTSLLEDALGREPENTLLWGILARVTATSDPARSREAAARERELNPLGGRG